MSEIEKPTRSWQEIAEEASYEKVSKGLQQLSEELDRALEERGTKFHPQSSPESKETECMSG